MKKIIIVELTDDGPSINIYVDTQYKTGLDSRELAKSILKLGGEALIVPSPDGELSMQHNGITGYQLFDKDNSLDEWFCSSQVENAIGTSFRKKPFTFYLREI